MIKKIGKGDLLIFTATLCYVICLFLPWADVAFNSSANGFAHRGYLVLLLFAYPLYTAILKKHPRFFGLVCSVSAVVFLVYYLMEVSQSFMGTKVSEPGVGLYLAILSSCMLAVGTVLKMRQTNEMHESGRSVK